MRDCSALARKLFLASIYAPSMTVKAISCLFWDASQAVAALQRQIVNLNKMVPTWISVEERKPDANDRVLACVNILGTPSVWDSVRWNGKEWEVEEEVVYDYWTRIDYPVTHWMPLPPPPIEAAQQKGDPNEV